MEDRIILTIRGNHIPITERHIGMHVEVDNGPHKGRAGELIRICQKKCWVLFNGEEKPRCLAIKNVSGVEPVNF